jgi:hypothetical protein
MFKKILITIRDFCFHFSKRQRGDEFAWANYRLRICAFIFIYYLGIIIVLGNVANHYNFMPINKNSSLFGRMSFFVFCFVIPLWLMLKWVLKTISDFPIKSEITEHEYKKIRNAGITILCIGVFFLLSCMVLPTYIRGGKIHIGSYVIQRK